jgi:hypothetical protein
MTCTGAGIETHPAEGVSMDSAEAGLWPAVGSGRRPSASSVFSGASAEVFALTHLPEI